MPVKVILRTDVPKVGKAGDVKQVAPGFARNYLIPRGLATAATEGALAAFKRGESKRAVAVSDELKAAKRVYFSCLGGFRSGLATKTLNYLGHPDAVNVTGGYKAWSSAGLPTQPGPK